MKKILAVILSAVLCGGVIYSVGAEEVALESDDVEVVTDVESTPLEDFAGELAEDEYVQEKADEIVEAIQTGSSSDDIVALLGDIEKYINAAGFELSDLEDAGAVRDVIDAFLEDAGIDAEALNNAISESTIANAVLGIYYTAPEETPEEDYIPDTGFRG